jgi:hypothetical protein
MGRGYLYGYGLSVTMCSQAMMFSDDFASGGQ